jgi:hypothetical protein
MEKGLQLRTGQTHVQRYTLEGKDLLAMIEDRAKLDTTFLISHGKPWLRSRGGGKLQGPPEPAPALQIR